MKKPMKFMLLMICFTWLTACRTIFHADFNSDVVGEIPASMPAGSPPDDHLVSQGSPGSVVVIQSDLISSKAVSLDRGGPPATLLAAYPTKGPHTGGLYLIRFKAYGLADESNLYISVLSQSSKKMLLMTYGSDAYTLSSGNGSMRLPGTYSPGTLNEFLFKIDMTRKRFSVAINGNFLASNHRFLDTAIEDLASIQFKYTEAILEAFPGKYVLDDLFIKKKKSWWPWQW